MSLQPLESPLLDDILSQNLVPKQSFLSPRIGAFIDRPECVEAGLVSGPEPVRGQAWSVPGTLKLCRIAVRAAGSGGRGSATGDAPRHWIVSSPSSRVKWGNFGRRESSLFSAGGPLESR